MYTPKGSGISTARELCYIAVATATLAVCSWIAVPLGEIPVTLQTLGVFFVSGLLGARRAFFAVVAYLLLGFCGVPVFAGFTGGVGKLFTPTGGYLIGFPFAASLIGWLCKAFGKGFFKTAAAMLCGMLAYYAVATAWFVALTAQGIIPALALCVLPYLPFDIIKIAVAASLVKKFRKASF